ncbi:MAG TPA: hypothetical protein VHI77_09225 [Solirubrobacterales bacterium]|jgi:hypothetical protein|nr:hypothetical protein [Solirubrobacterales bacterium]
MRSESAGKPSLVRAAIAAALLAFLALPSAAAAEAPSANPVASDVTPIVPHSATHVVNPHAVPTGPLPAPSAPQPSTQPSASDSPPVTVPTLSPSDTSSQPGRATTPQADPDPPPPTGGGHPCMDQPSCFPHPGQEEENRIENIADGLASGMLRCPLWLVTDFVGRYATLDILRTFAFPSVANHSEIANNPMTAGFYSDMVNLSVQMDHNCFNTRLDK